MIIKNGTILTPLEQINDGTIKIENGIISSVGTFDLDDAGHEIIDAADCYICPGLVDIHTHGGGGGDYMDATEDSFEKALAFQAKNGVTSVLTSSVTAPVEQIEEMLCVTRSYQKKQNPICRVLGAHIEGPYVSLKNKGAQNERYLRVPAKYSYDFLLKNADVVKNVTIASELEGAKEMTEALTKQGIVVSCGHDDGQKETLMPIINAGMTNCTHWSCAMSTVAMRNGVRSVGLTELGLIDSRLTLELIADNHHLTPELVKLAYMAKGPHGVLVVSDCLRAGGMPVGDSLYTLGNYRDKDAQKFIVSDGVARLPAGSRYAGSLQPISQMVRNLVNYCNIPLQDAICIASLTPATVIHAEHMIGSISVGKKADICIMDKNLNVITTIVDGKKILRGVKNEREN